MTRPATVATVRVERIDDPPRDARGHVSLDAIVDALGRARCVLLESTPGTPHAIPWSVVAPIGSARLEDDGRTTRWWSEDGVEDLGADPFAALEHVCARLGLGPDTRPERVEGAAHALPPFTGGLVGAFSYDLGRRIEPVTGTADDDRSAPALWLAAAPVLVAVDHRDESALLVSHELPGVAGPRPETVRARLRNARTATVPLPPDRRDPSAIETTLAGDRYDAAVRAVLEHIAAGDVFQVNVTRRLTARWDGDAHELYRRLRAASPAPHGAVVPAVGIASISPETFLAATGRRVATRPMKGTRRRHEEPARDQQARAQLEASAKDRAENVMVVDMQRNDLGRVCEPGSVHVPGLCEVEAHPTVWQLVSTVEGRLRDGAGWSDLVRACFPCGSVTGTPKVRAMQIIDDLEPVRRSWYCGAVGWLGAGSLRLSVAIRTAVARDGRADYGTGGGIVADSDARSEHDETDAKAAAFRTALGVPADA